MITLGFERGPTNHSVQLGVFLYEQWLTDLVNGTTKTPPKPHCAYATRI
jgi:hypothetical protein